MRIDAATIIHLGILRDRDGISLDNRIYSEIAVYGDKLAKDALVAPAIEPLGGARQIVT